MVDLTAGDVLLELRELRLLKAPIASRARRPDGAITHSEAGGLSMMMKLEESIQPKKSAPSSLLVRAWTVPA